MDFLDDTTRVNNEFNDDDFEAGFYDADADERVPPSEPLFLSEPSSDDEVVELPKPKIVKERPSSSPETMRPAKRRRIDDTLVTSSKSTETGYYIGEFLVDGAFSLVSGKNAIKAGDQFTVSRDAQDNSSKAMSVKKDSKVKGKQTTLNGFVSQSTKAKNAKKADHIVRFLSQQGFQLGRLPVATAEFVGVLMDNGLARFAGNVIEAPQMVRVGDSVLLSLKVYLNSGAFDKMADTGEAIDMLWEGSETLTEKTLRERKTSLLKLFDMVGLKPRTTAPNVNLDALSETPVGKQASKGKNAVRVETIGEGEDAEEVEVVDDGEELDKRDIDMIYQKAQKHDQDMEEMEPAETFVMNLRPYQKQALRWMKSMEEGIQDARMASSMHPLWQEFSFPFEPSDEGIIDLCDEEQPFYFNPYSGELSLEFPKLRTHTRGGILADVGMGKTIQIASLIHTVRHTDDDSRESSYEIKPKMRQLAIDKAFKAQIVSRSACRATLVIAPTSLISQWASELQRASKPGTLSVMVWHGTNRATLEADIDGLDVLITSYGVLVSEFAKHGSTKSNYRSPLFETVWFRIVLDEAHYAKSRVSKTAKAAYTLNAKRRWVLTGTPIVNRLEDLQSLLRFLDYKPWSEYPFFRSFITVPFLARDRKALDVVQVILETILLRREKSMKDKDGNPIVTLPSKTATVETLDFSPLERQIYNQVYHNARSAFKNMDAKGTVGKNWHSIFALLMRLRRAVLHPSLIAAKDEEVKKVDRSGEIDVDELIKRYMNDGGESNDTGAPSFAHSNVEALKGNSEQECSICLEPMDPPVLIPLCMHSTCKDCMYDHLHRCIEKGEKGHCPICSRGPIKIEDLVEVLRTKRKTRGSEVSDSSPEPEDLETRKPEVIDVDADSDVEEVHTVEVEEMERESSAEVIFRKNNFQSSTKLDALMRDLRHLREEDPSLRAVVFSQFTGFLDLIEIALDRDKFPWVRLDGSMSEKQRTKALKQFSTLTDKPRIFIISLRAGGVGLNLTSANHVFMMDCWWNAATEQQAIDRVHRLGQERDVFVKHFIIRKTVEQKVLAIQKRKTAIVSTALGKTNASSSEGLDNLRIMFGDDEEDSI